MFLEGLVIPISFDTGLLLKGIDLIKGAIEGAVESTFEWADSIDKLGDVTGMATAETSAWAYVTKKAGVPVSTLTRGLVILEKGLVKADGTLDTMGETLKDYGISVKDSNGKVKDQSALMNEIARQYAGFSSQQERVNFLTGIFGRSGADLIDVFDTLAAEGGIDAVSAKVAKLGLAIDPARYENFTRSLEEIKMAGLGLQVAFTEKIMPIFEALVSWGLAFANADWPGKLAMIQDVLTKWNFEDLTLKLRNWIARVDWGQVSQEFAAGMAMVDWAGVTTNVINGSVNIGQALIDLLSRTDWGAIKNALFNAFTGVVRDGIGKALVTAWTPAAEQFWILVDTLMTRIRNSVSEAINAIVTNWAASVAQLMLPWWLTPGSPTPLENGLRGIGSALNDIGGVNVALFGTQAAAAPAPAVASGDTFNYAKFAAILAAEIAKVAE